MKILWIASAFPPAVGGSAHLYANICRQLRRAAVVLAPRRSYENGAEFVGWSKWDEQQPFKVFRLDMLRPQYRPKPKTLVHGAVRWYCEDRPIEKRVLVESLRIIREECVDVVCLGELYSLHALGHAVRRRQGVPLIYYIHGEEITVVPPARRYVWGAFKALRDADGIIAVSSFTRDQLIRRVGVSPTRIHLITNGVDTILFSPGPKDIELVRRYGLSGKKVLLTVGRLEPRKGHDTVLRALPEITRQVPQTVYMIVGKGSQLDRLRNMVTEHGLADQVIFATDVSTNDLVRFYRTADAFVMPNRVMPNGDTEGFGQIGRASCRERV